MFRQGPDKLVAGWEPLLGRGPADLAVYPAYYSQFMAPSMATRRANNLQLGPLPTEAPKAASKAFKVAADTKAADTKAIPKPVARNPVAQSSAAARGGRGAASKNPRAYHPRRPASARPPSGPAVGTSPRRAPLPFWSELASCWPCDEESSAVAAEPQALVPAAGSFPHLYAPGYRRQVARGCLLLVR